jgi:hypothetical protein
MYGFLDNTRRVAAAQITPGIVAIHRRQSAQVLLDQRAERGFVDGAHEDEIEVTSIGESVLVKRERLFEISLFERIRSGRAAPHVTL